ncbi:Gpr119, partial [Symbiodinium necroappetens]
DPALIRTLKIPSNAVDSALQRCPDWFSIVRVVLECRLEPDEPACVDCIETQDECGRTVGRHEAYTCWA